MSSKNDYSEYDYFARMYNESWGPRYCKRNLPLLEKLLLQNLPDKAQILDVCCGTGQLVQQLLTKGYQVTGLDASEAMLGFARKNAPDAEFILSDARSFKLLPTFHGVVSTSASLNHFMNLEDLTSVFHSVYAAMLANGVFVVDMNMEEAYKLNFLNRVEDGDVQDDYAWASRSSYNSQNKTGQINMTLFSLQERENWRRFDTTSQVRGYSQQEVQSALEKVGFTEISVYDAERDFALPGALGKTLFVCHKKNT